MRQLTWIGGVGLFGLVACAGRPATPTTPQREEIVVEEGSVVHASAGAAADPDAALPPLPGSAQPSAALASGLALGRELLRAAAPAPAPDDQAGYDAWLRAELAPWLETRGRAVQAMLVPLSEVPADVQAEQTVAAALVGLTYTRTHDQLLGVPAPPPVRTDPKLEHVYKDEVNKTSAAWVESAVAALRRCATLSAVQRDVSFVPWLDRCQTELARLEREAHAAQALAELVAEESGADAQLRESEGPSQTQNPNPSPNPTPNPSPLPP